MALQNASEIFQKMDEWFAKGKPFFFLIDYNAVSGDMCPLEDLEKENIFLSCPIYQNSTPIVKQLTEIIFTKYPESFESYASKFNQVISEIRKGNSYLTNLTSRTPVEINCNLSELYTRGIGKYKLFYKDHFIHFSPETFVRINADLIETFPMKGTIDASLENAEKILLENQKEETEQFIITDLLRNDLSMVAKNVKVNRFRYVEKVETNNKPLLQVSSHITGNLTTKYQQKPGRIFSKLLPAGSICGAPKLKTLKILEDIEGYDRGFYTGVWGIFDGKQIDSCVIIRMLENTRDGYFFKSGGGITAASDVSSEYQEMIDKIYVPIY